jgi:hypothetical protein
MKILFYAIAAIGVLAIIGGIALKFVLHHSHGLETLGVGGLLLVVGIACAIFLKPKAVTTA